jgi:transposase
VLPVEDIGLDVIQAPKPEPRITRYELTDFEWAAIRSFLQRFASANDVTRGSWIRRGLDKGTRPPARRVGQYPTEAQSQPICFSPYLYRARNLIERFFNKIKQCRRIATRYDKLAANDLAFIKLASIRIWLRC